MTRGKYPVNFTKCLLLVTSEKGRPGVVAQWQKEGGLPLLDVWVGPLEELSKQEGGLFSDAIFLHFGDVVFEGERIVALRAESPGSPHIAISLCKTILKRFSNGTLTNQLWELLW